MTIQGAIDELMNLLDADDVPIYYKPSIEKVIDTIILERARRKAIVAYIDESNNRKTENSSEIPNNCEDDEYWKHLFIEVVKGHMSDAEANQAWYEYINHKDEPQTERSE